MTIEPVTLVWTLVVWAAALAASVLGGAPVTQAVLRAAARPGRPARRRPVDPASVPVPPPPTAGTIGTEAVKALRGGTWIGFLERFVVATLASMSWAAAVGGVADAVLGALR